MLLLYSSKAGFTPVDGCRHLKLFSSDCLPLTRVPTRAWFAVIHTCGWTKAMTGGNDHFEGFLHWHSHWEVSQAHQVLHASHVSCLIHCYIGSLNSPPRDHCNYVQLHLQISWTRWLTGDFWPSFIPVIKGQAADVRLVWCSWKISSPLTSVYLVMASWLVCDCEWQGLDVVLIWCVLF